MKSFFRSKKLVPGVYGITGEAVAKFLIVGEHHALLFDTGYGFGNLKEYVKTLTDLPLYVVNSHGHVDHAGANYQFDTPCYMHPADWDIYKRHQSREFRVISWKTLDKVQKIFFFLRLIIPKGYTQEQYLSNPVADTFLPVKEGMSFDLGGVTLEAVEIPGHTPGSIGLYCPEKRLFFSGDGMNGGTWLFLPESTKLSVYLNSLKKVKQLGFDYLITGHSTALEPKPVLDEYIDVAENLDFANGKPQKPTQYTPDVHHRQCFSSKTARKKKRAFVQISADKL